MHGLRDTPRKREGLFVDYVPLDELDKRRAQRNPKRHAEEVIGTSVDRFGFVVPPTINETTGRLVAGHGRVDALLARKAAGSPPPTNVRRRKDGEWLVPVVRGNEFATDADAEAYLVADNHLVTMGGWDPEEGLAMLANLKIAMPDLSALLKFDDLGTELQATLDEIDANKPPPDAPPDPGPKMDKADELQAKWKTAPGQLWEIPSKTAPERRYLTCHKCGHDFDV